MQMFWEMMKMQNWDRLLFTVHQQQVNLLKCFSLMANFRQGVMQIAVNRIVLYSSLPLYREG